MASQKYIMGIDGGGSKCRARLLSIDGTFLGQGIAGSANPLEGIDRSIKAIMSAVEGALSAAGLEVDILPNTVVGMGLAGVIIPERFAALKSWHHPFKELFLTHDQHIALLGAHHNQDGAVIITGTGSCGISLVAGEVVEFGAHGFPLGDKGGGAWFGLKALQHSLRSENNLGRETNLTSMIKNFYDGKNILEIITKMARATPAEFAKLAPIVFEAAEENDDVALEIIQDGAAYISRMAREILKTKPPRLSLLGGVGPRLLPWLDGEVSSHIVEAYDNAEVGALIYAYESLGLKYNFKDGHK